MAGGGTLELKQRAMMWPAATQAARAATEAVDLMFNAGRSASIYANSRLERCLRDIRTAGQHICVAPGNFEMVGQAFLDFDTSATHWPWTTETETASDARHPVELGIAKRRFCRTASGGSLFVSHRISAHPNPLIGRAREARCEFLDFQTINRPTVC
jgi:hypothetical protein